jgi:hypothetical protein
MFNPVEIPDIVEQQLDWLARRLFKERRAAVMVGAGFSRNAVLHRSDQRLAPTWWEITKFLGERLNLSDKTINTRDGKDIAGQFEITFGADALATAILEVVDNDSYSPSSLHTDLMRLPWSDIFTTNYDTLLEDAAKQVIDRSYNLVASIADLTSSRSPRIVKLHGSFPSQRPFIITSEHFRTYPKQFAPYVNLVQQSLMENTLVLLGFSGDDPNFKAWAGWVRDELGNYAPHILLVTMGVEDSTQQRYFENQGINVLDLSKTKFDPQPPESEKYRAAYTWFFAELNRRKGINPKDWPAVYNPFQERTDSSATEKKNYVSHDFSELFDYRIDILNDDSLPLQKRLEFWKIMRQRYPGWILCPFRQRNWFHQGVERLFMNWGGWADWLLNNPNKTIQDTIRSLELRIVGKSLELEIASEICWWFKTLLSGLPEQIMQWCIEIWERNDIYKNEIAWNELGFGILRTARINLNQELFSKTLEILKTNNPDDEELDRKLTLEELEFSVSRLDHQTAKALLKTWKPNWNNPFSETRRASYLAQLGQVEDAILVVKQALDEIRKRISYGAKDYGRLSEEGWTLNLLEYLEKYQKISNADKSITETKERFEQLEQDLCDPTPEIINTVGDIPFKIFSPSIQNQSGRDNFDPNRYHRFSQIKNNTLFELIKITAFLEIIVQGAAPYRIGNFNINGDAIEKIIIQIWQIFPAIATLHAIRGNQKAFIENHFTRESVLALNDHTVKQVINILLRSLENAIVIDSQNIDHKEIKPGRYADDVIFTHGIEVLSRLTLRMSDDSRLRFLDLIIKSMYLKRIQTWLMFNTPLENAFRRIFDTIEASDLTSRIKDLLSMPIIGEESFAQGQNSTTFPEPFSGFNLFQESINIDLGIDRYIVNKLLFLLNSKNLETKKRAILRLGFLHSSNALKEAEKSLFAYHLWNGVGENQLPDFDDLYRTTYLDYPSPPEIDVLGRIKQYLIHSPVPNIQNSDRSYRVGPDENSHFFDELTVLLSEKSSDQKWEIDRKELEILFTNIITWWQHEGISFVRDSDDKQKKDQVKRAIVVTSNFLIPKLLPLSKSQKKKLKSWFSSIESAGFNLSVIASTKLLTELDTFDNLVMQLEKELSSPKHDLNLESGFGVMRLVKLITRNKKQSFPSHLIELCLRSLPFVRHELTETMWEAIDDSDFVAQISHSTLPIVLNILHRALLDSEIKAGDNLSNPPISGIAWSDRLMLRKRASKFAAKLWDYFQKNNEPIPNVLNLWCTEAKNDLLPEVRLPWIKIESNQQ